MTPAMIHSFLNLPLYPYQYHLRLRTGLNFHPLTVITTFPSSPSNPSQNCATATASAIIPATRREYGNRRVQLSLSLSLSNNPAALEFKSADIIRNFYDGINRRDLASVQDLIALNCVYEDLVFPQPFVGRQAILNFFKQFIDSISTDLQFVIDDISEEDTSAVGVTWHLEWKGKPFPFSKGCSFYRLEVVDGQKQIVYGRDCVEPAIKPGETALVAIRGVTWLLQKFPFLADRL